MQRTLKSDHLLFQLYHLHVDREATKKALRKKKQEEETVRERSTDSDQDRSTGQILVLNSLSKGYWVKSLIHLSILVHTEMRLDHLAPPLPLLAPVRPPPE